MVPIGALKGHSKPQDVCQDFAPLAKNDGSSSFQIKTFVNAMAGNSLCLCLTNSKKSLSVFIFLAFVLEFVNISTLQS